MANETQTVIDFEDIRRRRESAYKRLEDVPEDLLKEAEDLGRENLDDYTCFTMDIVLNYPELCGLVMRIWEKLQNETE